MHQINNGTGMTLGALKFTLIENSLYLPEQVVLSLFKLNPVLHEHTKFP